MPGIARDAISNRMADNRGHNNRRRPVTILRWQLPEARAITVDNRARRNAMNERRICKRRISKRVRNRWRTGRWFLRSRQSVGALAIAMVVAALILSGGLGWAGAGWGGGLPMLCIGLKPCAAIERLRKRRAT